MYLFIHYNIAHSDAKLFLLCEHLCLYVCVCSLSVVVCSARVDSNLDIQKYVHVYDSLRQWYFLMCL